DLHWCQIGVRSWAISAIASSKGHHLRGIRSAPDRIRTCDLRFRRPIRRVRDIWLSRAVSVGIALLRADFRIYRSAPRDTAFGPSSPFSEGRNQGGLGGLTGSLGQRANRATVYLPRRRYFGPPCVRRWWLRDCPHNF